MGTKIDIRDEDTLFRKVAIRLAMGTGTEERADPELGESYDVLSTPALSVTTHFSAFGWYHVTHVEAEEEADEDAFWTRLQKIAANNPRLVTGM